MITIIVTVLVLVLVYKSFCNTVCSYGHANKVSCCFTSSILNQVPYLARISYLLSFSVFLLSRENLVFVKNCSHIPSAPSRRMRWEQLMRRDLRSLLIRPSPVRARINYCSP